MEESHERTIELSGNWAVSDFRKASLYRDWKPLTASILLFIGASTVLFSIGLSGNPLTVLIESFQRSIGLSILVLAIALFIREIIIRKEFQSFVKQHHQSKIIIREKGIEQYTSDNVRKRAWSEIFQVKETHDMFLVSLSQYTLIILPKRFFSSKEDISVFREFAKNTGKEEALQEKERTSEMKENNLVSEEGVVARGYITLEDYKAYTNLHHKPIVIGFFVLMVIVLIFLSYTIPTSVQFSFSWILWYLLVPFLIVLIATGAVVSILRRQALREYKSNVVFKREQTTLFRDKNILQIGTESVLTRNWNDILKVREYRGMLLVYLEKRVAIIIPFRFFETEEELQKAKELIRKHIDVEKISIND